MGRSVNSFLSEPEDLFKRCLVSALTLEDAARSLLTELLSHGDLVTACLELDDPAFGQARRFEANSPPVSHACVHHLRQDLIYGAETIGCLSVGVICDRAMIGDIQAGLARLSRPLARYYRRYAVQTWSMAQFGQPMALVGVSSALLSFEALLERATLSELPVLLTGEFGTEKLLCALSIHCLGPRRRGAFIEINCSEPDGDPGAWFAAAKGGTLFFNSIEKLSPVHQERVPQYMRSHLGQWLKGAGAGDVRVIASTGVDLGQRVIQGCFSRTLLSEVHILSLALSPLRQRRGDIEPLIDWALRRRNFDPVDKKTADMVDLFHAYDWPENLVELERVTTRLAVMTDDRPIDRADIEQHAPWIMAPRDEETTLPTINKLPAPELHPNDSEDWAEVLSSNDQAPLGRLHPGLRRALQYLTGHCNEALSLNELADFGHVSPSHLGYLFRTELGTSFKQLQSRLRVLHARKLLMDSKRVHITEIALTLGFSDLSHFEKAFRRQLGESPSAFRQSHVSV